VCARRAIVVTIASDTAAASSGRLRRSADGVPQTWRRRGSS